MVTIAAAGDVHASEATRARLERSFAALEERVDLVLLAGDLTTLGEPDQAVVLADACDNLRVPVCAVLGNHDLHCGRGPEVTAVLRDAGVHVLDRSSTTLELAGGEVGIVGTKGFVGGFVGSQLPDFGEPLLRRVYEETTAEVEAIRSGLQEIAHCPVRVVLLHYSPTSDTSAAIASRRRSRSTGRTSSSTVTRTGAASRARSARPPSTTSLCTSRGATSTSSSSKAMRWK